MIGDFNDDLDGSITPGNPSPYLALLNDSADYRFPTQALSNAGIATTVDYPDTIDQHLATNEAYASYIANSVAAYRVDQYINNYGTTTSDHYPVLSRYTWSGGGGGGGGAAQLVINEILANEPGSDTAGEFVEIVNVGGTSISIGGYTLSDASSVRHTFAGGTTLAAGKAIVVYGGAAGIPGGLDNAVSASTGTLSLANGGDSVTLKTGAAASVQTFSYSSSLAGSDGVSMNRSPDGSATGSFVLHTTLSSLSRSPGTKASGAAW